VTAPGILIKKTQCCANYETRTTSDLLLVGASASQPSGAGGDLLHTWNAMRGPHSEKRNNKAEVADLRRKWHNGVQIGFSNSNRTRAYGDRHNPRLPHRPHSSVLSYHSNGQAGQEPRTSTSVPDSFSYRLTTNSNNYITETKSRHRLFQGGLEITDIHKT
jgi:hypothetical protein